MGPETIVEDLWQPQNSPSRILPLYNHHHHHHHRQYNVTNTRRSIDVNALSSKFGHQYTTPVVFLEQLLAHYLFNGGSHKQQRKIYGCSQEVCGDFSLARVSLRFRRCFFLPDHFFNPVDQQQQHLQDAASKSVQKKTRTNSNFSQLSTQISRRDYCPTNYHACVHIEFQCPNAD